MVEDCRWSKILIGCGSSFFGNLIDLTLLEINRNAVFEATTFDFSLYHKSEHRFQILKFAKKGGCKIQ